MIDIEHFKIPKELFTILIEHAKATAPYESVSIIAGEIKDKTAFAKKIFTPENIDRSTVSFTVDPLKLFDVYSEVEKLNLEIIGIYHTHPAAPKPSLTDLNYMEVNQCVWLISAMHEPEKPNGFLLQEDGSLTLVKIDIIDD
ncbi:MAG: M67 family metallopeptidase [Asgard group archaeon]|nr:M67 family metallopeptidase [Asgard group archaeon]